MFKSDEKKYTIVFSKQPEAEWPSNYKVNF